jgi:glycosyltransferase involved in cell wall biosynthesis
MSEDPRKLPNQVDQQNLLRQAKMQQIISNLNAQLALNNARLAALTGRLAEIEGSRAWKLVRLLWSIRTFLAPSGSLQARLLKRVLHRTGAPAPESLAAAPSPAESKAVSDVALIAPEDLARLTMMASPEPPSPSKEDQPWPQDRFPWPLISVLLPVYNHADMLYKAARSVLDSTYPRLELIILDDGSSDAIEPVLEDLLEDPRVRVYRQPNQKLPRALTHAHAFTRGEFITWTSADNLMTPQALDTLTDALLAHPEAVLAYADVSLIDEAGLPMVDCSYRPGNIDPYLPDALRLYQDDRPLGYEPDNYINACFLYRRAAAQVLEGHYADDLRGLEDYDFWLRLQKCGRLYHVRNTTPLYYYRVHQRSMSYDLVKNEQQAHYARLNQFIEYEAQCRNFAEARWSVFLDNTLPAAEKEAIQSVAALLPIDLAETPGNDSQVIKKQITCLPVGKDTVDPIRLRPNGRQWRLEWQSAWTGQVMALETWRGISLPPLVLKARQHRPNGLEFPTAAGHQVFGCHLALGSYPLDVALTRQIVAETPWAFFIFIDVPGESNASVGFQLVTGLPNAVYLGEKWYGGIYPTYAHFDQLWLPPSTENIPENMYRLALALAYASGRPLVAPYNAPWVAAPYQFSYQPQADSLVFTRSLNRDCMDKDVLDRYLLGWEPPACLARLLAYANELLLPHALARPDFGLASIPDFPAALWPQVEKPLRSFKAALAVDALDTGGLEGVVAQLARHLSRKGVETFILCAGEGGRMADQLRLEGLPVYLAGGSPGKMEAVLLLEKPALVNSHHAPLPLLQAARQMGLPVVETIHNTYAWFSPADWQLECQRSHYFTAAIAVSQLVREYYSLWNGEFDLDKIAIIGNAVDTSRLVFPDRLSARRLMDYTEHEFVFLSLARYDSVKNLIGMMAAFEEVHRSFPQARLLCAGKVDDDIYYKHVRSYWEELSSREYIRLEDFRPNTGILLAAADAFVLDSFFEGWSLSATEALLAGLPLIHSDCGSGRELIGPGMERGLLVPNPAGDPLQLERDRFLESIWSCEQPNKAALVTAMSSLIEQRDEWQKRRPATQEYARKAFRVCMLAQSYRDLFEKIAAAAGAPGV